jgi:hypothetical protein
MILVCVLSFAPDLQQCLAASILRVFGLKIHVLDSSAFS